LRALRASFNSKIKHRNFRAAFSRAARSRVHPRWACVRAAQLIADDSCLARLRVLSALRRKTAILSVNASIDMSKVDFLEQSFGKSRTCRPGKRRIRTGAVARAPGERGGG